MELKLERVEQAKKYSIIIYDFEVFKHDVLLGIIGLNNNQKEIYQMWHPKMIKEFYELNKNSMWIGHNNSGYDNYILDAIVNSDNNSIDTEYLYKLSKEIITTQKRDILPRKLNIKLNCIDLMKIYNREQSYSLKMTEAAFGKRIFESQINFDRDEELYVDEYNEVEKYNQSDLEQTYDNFLKLSDNIALRLDLIKEFNLDSSYLNSSEGTLAAKCLNAIPIKDIEKQYIKPIWYDNLKVNNEVAKEFYLSEHFKNNEEYTININGTQIKGGNGGIHGALNKTYFKKAWYFDVSGYYNLVMINYDLLPRTLNEKAKKKYTDMYFQQLELKKTNPNKRKVFKTILLAVFGSTLKPTSKFYDVNKGQLITAVAQMFNIDLLEKLKDKAIIIQDNTDGLIVAPYEWTEENEKEILNIVNEWEMRTKFTIKKELIYDIYQRDVNCYMYKDDKGNIHALGEALCAYNNWENPFSKSSWSFKEPPIIAHCIVDYLMNKITPEETIEKYKNKLRMFQYICKKSKAYNKIVYKVIDCNSVNNNEEIELQDVNRVFALKNDDYVCSIGLYKDNKYSKYPSLPNNVFVYNDDIRDKKLANELPIDYNYYIKRSYEKINTFVNTPLMNI